MNARTRDLLRVVSDDVARDILDHCEGRARSIPELISATGAARPTVNSWVDRLALMGLLRERAPQSTGSTGRSPITWIAGNMDVVDSVERVAAASVLDLLDRQRTDQQREIEERRQREIRGQPRPPSTGESDSGSG
jgi:hypothetical protein